MGTVPRRALAAALVVLLTGCLQELRVPPGTTDPAITTWVDDHVVVRDRSAAPRRQLFLFLPGSFGRPASSREVLREAARQGLHAVGLAYPNDWTVHSLCRSAPEDPRCEEDVRREILDGIDRTPLVDVDRANSVEHRLVRLLEHLHASERGAGWDGFLRGDRPRWARIVVAGHSQGAGHAAMLARHHVVAGVVMFSSPSDTGPDGGPARWIAGPHVTPSNRYVGFVHAEDKAGRILRSWRAMGVPGAPTVVDGRSPPYGGSHVLLTELAVRSPHGSTVVDRRTPRDAEGTPVFAPVWRHLCCSRPST